MNKIIRQPIFWGGTALVVFAYFTAKGSAQESGQGVENALTIAAIGAGAAMIIYSIRKTQTAA